MSKKRGISRRKFMVTGATIGAGAAGALGAYPGCGAKPEQPAPQPPEPEPLPVAQATEQPAPPRAKPRGRVVILGFDGVEPSIIDRMLEAGELPNLAALREEGAYARLGTTIPPQSPAAWTSFATCKNPGGHGIYDFIRRDPATYFPAVGTGKTAHATLSADGSVKRAASSTAYRKGQTFWSVADRAGARCKILNVPFVYPPDTLKNGQMLSGLGVPDIRNTTSTFFSMSDRYTAEDSVGGGIRLPLVFEGDKAPVMVPGARDPREKSSAPGAYVAFPVVVTLDRAARAATIEAAGQTYTLAEGEWSDWTEFAFEVTPKFTVHAISRFYVVEVGEQVRIYMACLQYHPKVPYVPFTHPKEYSGELADRYGLYKTIGWAFDTHALRYDALPEDAFLEDAHRTMQWREQLTLDELDRGEFDMLISAWTATDRVGHMFWRFRDPEHPLYTVEGAEKYGRALEDTYVKMDEIVAKVKAKLSPDDLLVVMSDHGFGTFRTGFNLNTWLVRNGYAVLKGQTDAATAVSKQDWLFDFDWAKTRAYAVGLSSMYLNQKGRERDGTVAPEDAGALIEEIRQKLLAVTDPGTGEKIFDAIYTRDDYSGEALAEAPDFSFGYHAGYQSSKTTAKGAVAQDLFEPCTDKWSGEHAASDRATTQGMFFTNRAPENDAPDITDLGPTALAYLGVESPGDFEGDSLLPLPPDAEPEQA